MEIAVVASLFAKGDVKAKETQAEIIRLLQDQMQVVAKLKNFPMKNIPTLKIKQKCVRI